MERLTLVGTSTRSVSRLQPCALASLTFSFLLFFGGHRLDHLMFSGLVCSPQHDSSRPLQSRAQGLF